MCFYLVVPLAVMWLVVSKQVGFTMVFVVVHVCGRWSCLLSISCHNNKNRASHSDAGVTSMFNRRILRVSINVISSNFAEDSHHQSSAINHSTTQPHTTRRRYSQPQPTHLN